MIIKSDEVLESLISIARQIVPGDVTAESDLMAMGLDSLGSLELSVSAQDDLGLDCSMDDVFSARSLGELAELLRTRTQD